MKEGRVIMGKAPQERRERRKDDGKGERKERKRGGINGKEERKDGRMQGERWRGL